MPLKVGTVQGKLEFVSQDLGVYTYDLCLQTTPARPEKLVTIHVSLGQSQTYTAHFLNYTKQRTEYTCKVRAIDKELLYFNCLNMLYFIMHNNKYIRIISFIVSVCSSVFAEYSDSFMHSENV